MQFTTAKHVKAFDCQGMSSESDCPNAARAAHRVLITHRDFDNDGIMIDERIEIQRVCTECLEDLRGWVTAQPNVAWPMASTPALVFNPIQHGKRAHAEYDIPMALYPDYKTQGDS